MSITSTLQSDGRFEVNEEHPDLVIVVGGDGTFLKAAHVIFPKNPSAHFLCFNAGTIGFYNDFDEEDVKNIPLIVFNETDLLGEIDTLEVNVNEQTFYAWNEFNITGLSQNIDYDAYLDHQYLEHFFGAGMIIATSTGSMAYNRSLNGAIIDPLLHVMELTEVAGIHSKAHKTIGNPMIIAKERTISFESESMRGGFLYADGFKMTEEKVHRFFVRLSNKKLHCYLKEKDYFVDRIHKTIDL